MKKIIIAALLVISCISYAYAEQVGIHYRFVIAESITIQPGRTVYLDPIDTSRASRITFQVTLVHGAKFSDINIRAEERIYNNDPFVDVGGGSFAGKNSIIFDCDIGAPEVRLVITNPQDSTVVIKITGAFVVEETLNKITKG